MRKDPKKTFGIKIKKLRKELNMSQEALADICGLHRTYVGAVERGERNISLENIVVIARALRVNPADLLKDIK
jgi:transcriptional regulator with XRE-family HTH domain